MPERALTLGSAAAAEFERLGIDFSGIKFWSELLERYFGQARRASGAAEADAAWQIGRNIPFDTAVAQALALR